MFLDKKNAYVNRKTIILFIMKLMKNAENVLNYQPVIKKDVPKVKEILYKLLDISVYV